LGSPNISKDFDAKTFPRHLTLQRRVKVINMYQTEATKMQHIFRCRIWQKTSNSDNKMYIAHEEELLMINDKKYETYF